MLAIIQSFQIQSSRSCSRLLTFVAVQKILIIRFSSIGDIVLTTPVIRCIKEQLKAEVHFITKKAYSGILESNPHVSKVYTIESEFTEVLNDLKNEKYNFVVDLHHNLRSTRLKRALGVASAAFPKLNRQKFFLTAFKWDTMPDIHIVDRYFKAVEKLGVINDSKGLDYFIPKEDEVDLQEQGIQSNYIAFSIGAQFATKQLPNNKLIELVQGTKVQVALLGGSEDVENATIISKACPGIVNLVGQLNLNQSASLVQQASKVLTHDTGLMHIASAFNKTTISVWGNTTPKLGMYPYQPDNSENFSIHEVDLKCRPCSKIGYQKCPKKHFNCMEQQDIGAILKDLNN